LGVMDLEDEDVANAPGYRVTWNQEHLPQEFRDATIAHIYKPEGNRQLCDNHEDHPLYSRQDPGPCSS